METSLRLNALGLFNVDCKTTSAIAYRYLRSKEEKRFEGKCLDGKGRMRSLRGIDVARWLRLPSEKIYRDGKDGMGKLFAKSIGMSTML